MTRTKVLVGLLAVCVIAGACSRSSSSKSTAATARADDGRSRQRPPSTAPNPCAGVTLQSTDIGITPTDITVEVMADVGSPLAPGLFQGNIDAINAFANYVNANGGIACRQLKVRTWDSKLDPTESKNGLIDACTNAFSHGRRQLAVQPRRLADDQLRRQERRGDRVCPTSPRWPTTITEQCAPTAFVIQAVSEHCPVTTGLPARDRRWSAPTKWYWLQQLPGAPRALPGRRRPPDDDRLRCHHQIAARHQVGHHVGRDTEGVRRGRPAGVHAAGAGSAKAKGSTFVYDGSNDVAMIRMRKEAVAQGLTSVKIWACSLACYTQRSSSRRAGPTSRGPTSGCVPAVRGGELQRQLTRRSSRRSAPRSTRGAPRPGRPAWPSSRRSTRSWPRAGPTASPGPRCSTALKGITNFTADGWLAAHVPAGLGRSRPAS